MSAGRRFYIVELSVKLGMGYRTVQRIFMNDWGMRRVCTKFVPHLVTDEQK